MTVYTIGDIWSAPPYLSPEDIEHLAAAIKALMETAQLAGGGGNFDNTAEDLRKVIDCAIHVQEDEGDEA